MKIRSCTVTPVAFADPPLLSAFGLHDPVALRSIIQLHCDDGLVGLGESYGDLVYLTELNRAAEALVGIDPLNVNDVKRALSAVLGGAPAPAESAVLHGATRLFRIVYAAFEMACLDIKGKHLGVSVSQLLGGRTRDSVECSGYLFYRLDRHPAGLADGWGRASEPHEIVEQARRMVDRFGFQSLKLKGGVRDPEIEIETIEALHESFPSSPLRLDPNTTWDVETSIRATQRLAGRLEYLEDPVAGLAAMSEVARASKVPLATNMCTVSFDDLPETIRLDAVQIILADPHFWGGLTASMTLAALCETWRLGLSMHSNSHLGISLAAMAHLAAAAPNLSYAIDTHWPWKGDDDDVVRNAPSIIGGELAVPLGPGLGVDLDADRLEKLHRAYEASPVHSTDQARYIRSVPNGLVSFVRPVVSGRL